MSAGFRAGQANDGYLQINGTDILTISSGVLGVKNTGVQSEVRLYCESNNAHYASLKSPPHSDFIGNVTFTLPGTSGSSGQVLQTDGSGNLSWVNQSGGGGGGGVSDKMSEGNTEAEVVDTGSDGHFKVTTEGVERLRVDSDGNSKFISNARQIILRNDGTAGLPKIDFRNSDDTGNAFGFINGATLDLQTGGTTRLQIDSSGEIVSHNGTLRRDVSNSSFTVTGDTASNTGANINLYGASHSSLANIFRVRTGATERLRVGPSGQIGIGGANYGTSGQVLTSGGASGAVSWTTISGGGGSYGDSNVDNHLNSGGASSGQILSWNGSDYAWVADQGGSGGGGISDVVDDTTPQLGGNLDLNSNNITGTGNISITGTFAATTLSGSLPTTDLTGTITNAQLAGSIADGKLASTFLKNVVEDTTPQLGGNLDVQAREINTSTSNGNIKLTPNGTGVVEVRGAGGGDGTLQLNCSAQSHGIKLKSPPHSAAATYTLTFPNNIVAGKFLTSDASGNLSWGDDVTGDASFNGVRVGQGAGNQSTNTAVGLSALNNNTTGYRNTAVGEQSLKSNIGGIDNTSVGQYALRANTSGNSNIAVGRWTLLENDTGYSNTGIGTGVLTSNTSGHTNIAIGFGSGTSITTGSGNTIIGCNITGTSTLTNTVIIGAGNGTERLRITSDGNVGIGTDSPTSGNAASSSRFIHIHNSDTGTTSPSEIYFTNNNSGVASNVGGLITFFNSDFYFWNYANADLIFATGGAQKFIFDHSENTLDFESTSKIRLKGSVSNGTTHAHLNIGSDASNSETRAIDIYGGWSGGEYKSITYNHGTGTADILAQQRVRYNSSPSSTYYEIGRLYHGQNTTAYPIRFVSTGVTTADLELDGNLKVSSGNGINFSAYATSGNPSSNLLDDYEEGTFLPTMFGATVAGSSTYTLQYGYYVKVGKLVHFQIRMTVTSSTATGTMRIGGLPFVALNDTNRGYASINVSYANNISMPAGTTWMGAYTAAGGSHLVLIANTPGNVIQSVSVDTSWVALIGGTYVANV